MPVRSIIRIDESKCDGCGDCVSACAEGAIQIINGKAKLVSEVYCDGLGACIGECPQGAITIEKREAPAFDEKAVELHQANLQGHQSAARSTFPHGCPGSAARTFSNTETTVESGATAMPSYLTQWPVQLMLVPPNAPFLAGSNLVICADCVPFAVPDFHRRYLKGHSVLVGCPKLDNLQFYREKLEQIFRQARPVSITVLKMEVPCCNGIASAAYEAHASATPNIPFEVHTIGIRGDIRIEDPERIRPTVPKGRIVL